MKYILGIGLVLMLMAAMLLGASSVAYADEPPPADPPPAEPPPPDPPPGLTVDVKVVGNNADVGLDLYGDDNTAEVNFHSENPTVLINGTNINDPIAVYNVSNTTAVSNMGVRRLVKDVMFPYMSDTWDRLNLTADGLAKVILLAVNNESELETQTSLVNTHDSTLASLESETASLGGRVDALEAQGAALAAQDAAIQARITAQVSYVIDSYNRILAIIIGAFSVVVIGLGVGLWLTRRRTY